MDRRPRDLSLTTADIELAIPRGGQHKGFRRNAPEELVQLGGFGMEEFLWMEGRRLKVLSWLVPWFFVFM